MPFRLKVSLIVLALLIVVFTVVPLFLGSSEPPGARPLAEVAGPEAEYVEVEGVALHVERYGGEAEASAELQAEARAEPAAEPAERLILLLHGFPFSTASFDQFGPLLADYGEVVAVDLPGFGLSERPLEEELEALRAAGLDPYSAGGQVRLVAGLLRELGGDEVVLVGHDSGARLALDVALALEDPARAAVVAGADVSLAGGQELAGLVLIGASPYTSSQRSWLARAVMNSPQLERLGPMFLRQIAQEPGQRIVRAGWYDQDLIEQQDLDAYGRAWTVNGWDDALWQLTKADAPPSLEGSLGELRVPALVVAGAEDGVVPTTESERLAAELRDATLQLVPECGHAVQQECPQRLAAVVADWLPSRR